MKNVFLLQLISFYRNIVCKNIVCDVGLTVYSSMQKKITWSNFQLYFQVGPLKMTPYISFCILLLHMESTLILGFNLDVKVPIILTKPSSSNPYQ